MKKLSLLSRVKMAALLGSTLLLLTGCFDTKDEFTINPDGSGKVIHECTFQLMNVNLTETKSDPQEALQDTIRSLLQDAKGVDAWRDVTYKRIDGEHLYFHGTAYFKDLSKLQIPNQTILDFAWHKAAAGQIILDLRTNKEPLSDGLSIRPETDASTNLSPGDAAKKRKEERAKFEQTKPMLTAILGQMKQESRFNLPGIISHNSNFHIDSDGVLQINFDGAKFLDALDKLSQDDDWMKKNGGGALGSMDAKPVLDERVNELVFGAKAPVQAIITGATAPLFDYATEVAAARLDFAKTEKALGLSAAALAPPAEGEPLKNLRVVGVRLITESDQKRDLRPFNYDAGYTLVLRGDFSGSVLDVTEKSAVESAVADNGTSLLPEQAWDRTIHFPKLSKDKATVLFEVRLQAPGKDVARLKELSGHLHYTTGGGTKEIDLGITELKPGAKGTEFGASIESIKEGWQHDGTQMLNLKFNLSNPSTIKSLTLLADGSKTVLEQSSSMSDGRTCTLGYPLPKGFSATARLSVQVYDNVQAFDVPFKLENISLLGVPGK
jgi:hypothetical protein